MQAKKGTYQTSTAVSQNWNDIQTWCGCEQVSGHLIGR